MPITDAMVEAAALAYAEATKHFVPVSAGGIRAALTAALSQDEWQDIATGPKDGTHVLLFGTPEGGEGVSWSGPMVLSGYWDMMDEAWCPTSANWAGPFVVATKWKPLPAPPIPTQEEG